MSIDKIKIGYFADGPWSHLAFEKLIQDKSLDIKFIVPRTDTKDNTLKDYSIKYNIDYLFPVKINSPEFIAKVIDYDCDLLVSMSFNQIFKKQIINIAKYVINFYQSNKISCISKHAPGHGLSTKDSHLSLPVVTENKKFLMKNDFETFKNINIISFCSFIKYFIKRKRNQNGKGRLGHGLLPS